jgi:hypothetical protein
MYPSSDLLEQLSNDRQQDRRAAAAAQRLVATFPARMRIARSLRRVADRLDREADYPASRVRSPARSLRSAP